MFIYKITNKINNKIYIGQTTQSIKERWSSHLSISKKNNNNTYLHKSIKKYGKENFIVEKIDNASDLLKLNFLERYHIRKFNSLVPNGYNIQEGGKNSRHSKQTKNLLSNKTKEYFKKNKHPRAIEVIDIKTGQIFKSIRQAAIINNINNVTLTQYLNGSVSNPTFFRYFNKINKTKIPTKKSSFSKTVIDSKTGQIWSSIRKCAKSIGVNRSTIMYKIKNGDCGFYYG